MKPILLVAALLTLTSTALAQSNPPITRTVSGQVLKSKATPAVRLEFDKAFKYIGAQSFVLYDVANAEQHFFVDADKDGRVKRLYWIQFEGYLPSNTHTYKYTPTKLVNIGGFDFIADAYPRSLKGDLGRPDSDGNRARAFLAGKSLQMASTEFLSQRLVHLVDAARRNELMIIYIEDLSTLGGGDGGTGNAAAGTSNGAAGLTAADLAEGGRAHDRWNEIAQGLLARAQKNMKVSKQ